ncbi:response regulator transcription factor [Marinobacter xestospongiae]|uniref:Response regulator transcription factor n=1 Tax=Marinobacter xestospongiae TaxID=994319 RepID=A0ABU3VUW2_9GAMM|nr:response regulator transcription factor [Marinobacter xestospongiae]MDV2077986.1 response regulator transcription factor [Marinobacter xestospongiae]
MTIRVALVDDQNLIREGIKSLLQISPGIEVVAEADDGDGVIGLIRQHRPQVILLDLRMPRVSGLEVLQQLKEEGIKTPVLVLTTFDDHDLVLDCIRLGAKGYLRKDVSFEALTSAIASLANGDSWLQPAVTYRVEQGKPELDFNDGLPSEPLSSVERQVLRLVAAGYSNHEIADALCKSVGTIRNQVSSVLAKLNVRDRTRAVLKALDQGLI